MSIMAWRYWWGQPGNTVRKDYVLSGARGNYWQVNRPFVAQCHDAIYYGLPPHIVVPEVRCACGIYALKRTEDYSHDYFDGLPHVDKILGVVEIWGKIITAALGYRAQYGQIRALVDAPEKACAVYGVPNFPSVEYAQKEFFS